MSVIFEENNCKLITHNRQRNKYKSNSKNEEYAVYQLCETLFNNFKRKQKATSDTVESNDTETIIKDFLNSCKKMKLFLTSSIDEEEKLKDENIKLVNKFYDDESSTDVGYFHGENNLQYGKLLTIKENIYLIPSCCKFFNKKIEDMETFLPSDEANKFDFIVIDPPWKNRYIKRVKKKTGSKQGYFTMSDDEIMEIPLENYIKNSSIVIVWCTNSPSHITALQERILNKWNLKLLSRWQWVKIDRNGELFNNIEGNKKPFEQIFVTCHVNSQNNYQEIKDEKFIFSHPSSIHSHKPPLIDLFREFLPNEPKCLEIFARSLYNNFTSVGLEVLKLQNILLYEKIS
ncbi:CLUMA_CG016380, isoform A [Clunio marinus]|uniref:CLUMA_CG016380, isoform A n=1 Tax=Clunio marinus TaxID=568069 RepID=A0A1J1IUW4_9DIPT|nr:CLUMA_CG016380, isoform A [Clunio marinus]